ncbi:hypothetical protein L1987_32048 [Smallanthus sonchifolius]|uniref:Uncharacterized protein n=1 Tax=Smallanthus sonchifolius TaxID=185202 RepID=A0ACB9I7B0_9ASTR|nr:hypothetical protein L1987_32048 [Smallanthus sonchifolius]
MHTLHIQSELLVLMELEVAHIVEEHEVIHIDERPEVAHTKFSLTICPKRSNCLLNVVLLFFFISDEPSYTFDNAYHRDLAHLCVLNFPLISRGRAIVSKSGAFISYL